MAFNLFCAVYIIFSLFTGKGTMNTYWLEAAQPHNEQSNELAIHKMEIMVRFAWCFDVIMFCCCMV